MNLLVLLRALRKYWPANLVIVVTLSVTVAVLLATIAVAHNFFVAPWPYDSRNLGVLTHRTLSDAQPTYSFSAVEYRALRDSGLFEQISASRSRFVTLPGADGFPTRRLLVHTVPEAREVTGTQPKLGRFLSRDDASAAVISHDLWQAQFAGAADVIGRTLRFDDTAYSVIGVMPERFHFLGGDIWVGHERDVNSDISDARSYVVNFRPRSVDSLDELRPKLERLTQTLAANGDPQRYPHGWHIEANRVIDQVMGSMRPAVVLLICISALMLLIVLANVATLINVRQLAMESQLALRLALGATRRRLLLDVFFSNLLLAVIGVALGWSLGGVVFEQIVGMISYDWIPRELEGHFTYSTASLQWMPLVIVSCAVLMTLSQWPQLLRVQAESSIRGSARNGIGANALRSIRGLAGVQICAASMVGVLALCVWAGSSERGQKDIGLDVDAVMAVRLTLPAQTYPDGASRVAFMQRVEYALRAQPSIEQIAIGQVAPFQRYGRRASVGADGGSAENSIGASVQSTFGAFHSVLGIPLVAGRYFDDARDSADTTMVAVVNRSLAEKLWGSTDVVGRSLVSSSDVGTVPVKRTVVGVLEDAQMSGPLVAAEPALFVPHAQDGAASATLALLVRGAGGVPPAFEQVARMLSEVDSNVPLFDALRLSDRAKESMAGIALAQAIFMVFATLAIALALMGMVVVLQFLIAVRRREYAVRSAIGATPGRLFGHVFAEGLRIGILGIVVGGTLSWFVARLVSAHLYDATPWRPFAFAGMALVLILAALLATALPARRAAIVDPGIALRND
jgi:putative ABC transport system permease protein